MPFIVMEIHGDKQVAGFFDEAEAGISQGLNQVIRTTAERVLVGASERAPVSSGRLISSLKINFQKQNAKTGIQAAFVKASAPHAHLVEGGIGPRGAMESKGMGWRSFGKSIGFPSVEGIAKSMGQAWGMRRGGKRVFMNQAFLIARSIFRKQGTKPKPFLFPAYEDQKSAFDADVSRVLNLRG